MAAPDSVGTHPRTATRLEGFGTTIFAEMSALAARTGAINLGQGFPDSDGPEWVLEAAVAAIRAGQNQYPPGSGIKDLRHQIAAHQQRHYGLDVDPDGEVTVSTGATEAIAAALLALVEPGDEVIALEPYYDSYSAGISMAGGIRVPVTLRAPTFRLDTAALDAAVTDRTKLLLINSPHNPTGMVLSGSERQAIVDVATRHDLLVVTDDVYEHLVFEGATHVPLATYPGMWERTLTVSSAGKTFSVTGWKIGWATGPADLVRSLESSKQFLSFASGAPFQPAVAEALAAGDEWVERLRRDYQDRRDQLCEGLSATGMSVYEPQGTYFVTTDVEPLGYDDGIAFCRDLPQRCGVVAVPVQVFCDDPEAGRTLVRWAFCKQAPVLDDAIHRLKAGLG